MAAHNTCQTTKQAKAAFKARGSSNVTTSTIRQLERRNELERRAETLREREQRKKIQKQKKLADSSVQRPKPKLLATQRTTDRFGHRSSQFHLLNFVKRTAVEAQLTQRDAAASISRADLLHEENQKVSHEAELEPTSEPRAAILADLEALADCQTQVAHEIADCSPLRQNRLKLDRKVAASFASFTSDDMFLDQDDVAMLDAAAQQASKLRLDTMLMPPPGVQRRTACAPDTLGSRVPGGMSTSKGVDSDIGLMDLECLADMDVILTQAPCQSSV